MLDSAIRLLIGDMADKRAYRQMMKRVAALPKDYRFAFRKIRKYMYTVGPPGEDLTLFADLTMFLNLVELFEASAAEGRQVLDIISPDVAAFSDELMRASADDGKTRREKLNQAVLEKFSRKGQ